MVAKTYGSAVQGVDANIITIETNNGQGKNFHMVGLPDNAVKESEQRVESAIKFIGYQFPRNKVVVNLAPADIRKVLSTTMTRYKGIKAAKPDEEIMVKGKKYRLVNVAKTAYSISALKSKPTGSLLNRGANGGIAGNDVRIINCIPGRNVDVKGIDNHQIVDISIVTAIFCGKPRTTTTATTGTVQWRSGFLGVGLAKRKG